MVINTLEEKFYVFNEINERILGYALMYLRIAERDPIEEDERSLNYVIYNDGESFIVKFVDFDKKVELPRKLLFLDLYDYKNYLENLWAEKEANMRKYYKKYTGQEL